MAKYRRINRLSSEEVSALESITDSTPGMTIYGNKARCAVMLETDLAWMVSMLCHSQQLSVGELCSNLMRESLSIFNGIICFDDCIYFERDQLLLNLSMFFGGFEDYHSLLGKTTWDNFKKSQINIGNKTVAVISDNLQKILSIRKEEQLFLYMQNPDESYSISCDLRNTGVGFIILQNPLPTNLYTILTNATIK